MKANRLVAALLASGFSLSAVPAYAYDAAANTVTKLFMDGCLNNLGRPDATKAWAKAAGLQDITSTPFLKLFVGDGDKGGAWAFVTDAGHFAVSIRGTSQGCVAWAQAANPAETRANFQRLMEGVPRSGLTVTKVEDSGKETSFGQFRNLTYRVMPNQGSIGEEFILLTADRSGGPFQISIEAVRGSL